MSARDAILGRIRTALANEPAVELPPPPELWPAGTWTEPPDLAERFFEELRAVKGEGRRCASAEELSGQVEAIDRELQQPRVAVVEHPLCREAAGRLDPARVEVVQPGWDRVRLADYPLGVMPAEFLLADTGTAVLLPRSHAERLLCYLPTVAVVVAPSGALVPHLSDAWEALARRAAEPAVRGEMLLVTGPSRTADIEKKLVLGAHGPKRLVVLLVE
jgi:L-lactate dehydrogenase complex protein LldG